MRLADVAVALLLATSSAGASPPAHRADDLVDLATLAPAVRRDIRYATAANFTGRAVYPVAPCLLRREVAERIARVAAALSRRSLGLKVWDCYRPFRVQEVMWAVVADARYVARPTRWHGIPFDGSKHNRGAAVDLTLTDATGRELPMPTEFDDFTTRAHRGDATASAPARANAALLEAAMVAEGFEPMPTEWWHFDAPGWRRYPLADRPLVP